MLLHHAPDGSEHAVHGLAQVLAAVGRDEDEPGPRRPLELRVGVALAHRRAQRVDAGVAGNPDAALGLALVQQVPLAGLRRREVPVSDQVNCLSVELLRPGAVKVVRAQTGLNVTNRDLQVEARQRSCEGGRRISVHEHRVGPFGLEHGLQLEQHVACHVEERLARLHDGEIVIGPHIKDLQNLIQHLTVLAGYTHNGFELVVPAFKLVHERAHLDSLGTCPKYEHHFTAHLKHLVFPYFYYLIGQ